MASTKTMHPVLIELAELFLPLGFDLRKLPCDYMHEWGEDRRRTYLLKDTPFVYSVDVGVWPSVAQVLEFVGCFQFFWNDFDALEVYRQKLPEKNSVITIEASVLKEASADFTNAWVKITTAGEDCAMHAPPLNKNFLGFDVADRWGTSGLSNCAPSEIEGPCLRDRFSQALNDYHLFVDIGSATEFRDALNLRGKKDGPYFVYALWEVVAR